MNGRTRRAAVASGRKVLQDVINYIGTDAIVIISSSVYTLSRQPIRLAGSPGLRFSFELAFTPIEAVALPDRWMVQATSYHVVFSDRVGHELLAYHWHPQSRSDVTTPHFHLGSQLLRAGAPFGKAHLPSGWVTLAAIIRGLIRDGALPPQRPTWETDLDDYDRRLRASFPSEIV